MRIRDGKNSYPGSGINIPDPQHWRQGLHLPKNTKKVSRKARGMCTRYLFGTGPGEEDKEGGEEHENQLQEAPPRTRALHRLSLLTHFCLTTKIYSEKCIVRVTQRGDCIMVFQAPPPPPQASVVDPLSFRIHYFRSVRIRILGFDDRILNKSSERNKNHICLIKIWNAIMPRPPWRTS